MVVPKWKVLVEDIGAQLLSGQLKPGDQLLSSSKMCLHYKVSAMVVRNATLHLKALGIVAGVPGVGVFVADDAVARWKAEKERLNPQ